MCLKQCKWVTTVTVRPKCECCCSGLYTTGRFSGLHVIALSSGCARAVRSFGGTVQKTRWRVAQFQLVASTCFAAAATAATAASPTPPVCAGPLFSQLPALRAFIRELRPQLGSTGTTAALTACDELQALGQLLLDWGVGRDQLLLEPLLTPHAEYFSGALFQVRPFHI
jgi:hypothetical protein